MRDQTVTFQFMPRDKVLVKEFGIEGVVDTSAIQRSANQEQTEKVYSVNWLSSQGELQSRWFSEDQLEVLNK